MSRAIVVKDLLRSFGDPPIDILKSLTFEVEEAEFVAVTGRSGSGKSTLLYTVSGLDEISGGSVELLGINIHTAPANQVETLRNTAMGFVFQFHYLLPELTGLENILMPARKLKRDKELESYARELISRFDLEDCTNKVPSQMSGGQQQRVAIARALVMKPRVLFADEPTGNLDSVNSETVLKIFEEANEKFGTTILMVTHDEGYAARASRRIHLVDGTIDQDTRKKKHR
jgi:ABC-type lipoprotein export system ATPase subunit